MDVVDLDLDDEDEGSSPMERVAETPVETPTADDAAPLVPEGGDEAGYDGDEREADDDGVFRAVDSASERDAEIESVAEEYDSEEIRRVQMERACQLLTETDWSMERIAQAAGFSNAMRFSANFRHHKGIPPTTFRAASRAGESEELKSKKSF